MASVMIYPSETRTGPVKITVNEQLHTFERGKSYIVDTSVLEALQHSYEAQHVHVLDPDAMEPTPEMLPAPENAPPASKIQDTLDTFGKAKKVTERLQTDGAAK